MTQASDVVGTGRGPVRVEVEVLGSKRAGAYHHLTLVAPGVAERFRPGSLVALAVGSLSERLLLRAAPIHRVRVTGAYRSTIEVVLDPREPGEVWLAQQPAGTTVAALGPLGRPFALPKAPVPCLLVGVDVHAASLFSLAERLRGRGCVVHMLLAATTGHEVFGALEARRAARSVVVATEDGSMGMAGTVPDVLPGLLARTSCDVVYAAGPPAILHTVAATAEQHGAWSQTAVEVPLVCATGSCGSCGVPVVGEDGVARRVRACTEGPVFRGDRVRWAELGDQPFGSGRQERA